MIDLCLTRKLNFLEKPSLRATIVTWNIRDHSRSRSQIQGSYYNRAILAMR